MRHAGLSDVGRVVGVKDPDARPSVSTLPDYKTQFPQWRAKVGRCRLTL